MLWLAAAAIASAQCIPIERADQTYEQNFDGMGSVPPAGWYLRESGTSVRNDGAAFASDGSDGSGDVYSFGAASSSERAFGTLRSGTLIPAIGACFVNATGNRLTSVTISYQGEMWRAGVANRGAADRLDFQIGPGAVGLSEEEFGEPVEVDELDFRSPTIRTAAGAVNGNGPAFLTPLAHTIAGLEIEDGEQFWIRWTDFDIAGADDGLAIDDFRLTASSLPALSIGDVTAFEGNSGVTEFRFPLRLSEPAGPSGVAVFATLRDGTAKSGEDYVSPSRVGVAIPAGARDGLITVQVRGDTVAEPDEAFFVDVPAGTGFVIAKGTGAGTILDDDSASGCSVSHSISAIQGPGAASPLVGMTVTTSGIVTARKSNGYFLQSGGGDDDPATSDGIFVFTGSMLPARAAIGNEVCVSGTVSEFIPAADPFQSPLTQITNATISVVLATGGMLPDPVTIDASTTGLEPFEGMRVSVEALRVVGPSLGSINETNATARPNGLFFGVIDGLARPFREPGLAVPDPLPAGAPATIPRFDGNPERLRVASGATVAVGHVVRNLTGVLDYGFRTYTIVADSEPAVEGEVRASSAPLRAPGEITVSSLNLQRLFDDRNDPSIGEPVVNRFAYLRRLAKTALLIRDVLGLPDIIGVQEAENLTVLQELAATVTQHAPGTDYIALLEEGNDPGGIDVGFLVNAARVGLLEVSQHGKTEEFNDRPPLLLRAAVGDSIPLTVIVNHLRSLNDVDDPVAGARVREKRRSQAEFLAGLIQQRMRDHPGEPLLAIGDFNAFEFSDGYIDVMGTISGRPAPPDQVTLASPDLVDPDLDNLALTLPPQERYSYVFDGIAQLLDHVLVNSAARERVTRFLYTHANADFPETDRNDPATPRRVTDHDQPVVYLALPTATPGSTRARSSERAPDR